MTTYGPHRPEDQPTTVTVRRHGRSGPETQEPIHPGLLRQREQLNNHAAGKPRPLYGLPEVTSTD